MPATRTDYLARIRVACATLAVDPQTFFANRAGKIGVFSWNRPLPPWDALEDGQIEYLCGVAEQAVRLRAGVKPATT